MAGITFWLLLFADDMVIFARSVAGLNATLASLRAFFVDNDLVLSTEKTVCMHFNCPPSTPHAPVWYGDV